MRCEFCFGIGEVLVDAAGKIVTRLRDAAMMIPCPAGCIGGTDYCCSGAQPETTTGRDSSDAG